MYSYVLLLHVLAATVWTGGHLVVAVTVLPRALKWHDPRLLLDFESRFEVLGMGALAIQAATGLWMAYSIEPDVRAWLAMADPASRLIALKLLLLAITAVTALDARLRIIPTLRPETLPAMARRVVLVTVASVLFVVVGVSFRGGLLA